MDHFYRNSIICGQFIETVPQWLICLKSNVFVYFDLNLFFCFWAVDIKNFCYHLNSKNRWVYNEWFIFFFEKKAIVKTSRGDYGILNNLKYILKIWKNLCIDIFTSRLWGLFLSLTLKEDLKNKDKKLESHATERTRRTIKKKSSLRWSLIHPKFNSNRCIWI